MSWAHAQQAVSGILSSLFPVGTEHEARKDAIFPVPDHLRHFKVVLQNERSAFLQGTFDLTDEEQKYLDNLVVDRHHPIRVYNKICHPARNTQFYSDESEGYKFSGSMASAKSIPPILRGILDRVNAMFKDRYNGILVNIYKDGNDCIGAHADDESELGNSGVVMLVSGSTRKFRVSDKATGKKVLDVEMPSRCNKAYLGIMAGDFQKDYKHAILPQPKVPGRRISLTFRAHTDSKVTGTRDSEGPESKKRKIMDITPEPVHTEDKQEVKAQ